MTIIAGTIEHKLGGNVAHFWNEYFTNLFRFLSGPQAAAAGVVRIAYHSGSNATGIGYWDETFHFGDNAWGVFKFSAATVPFYLLIQYTDNAGAYFGTSPGNPALIAGYNNSSYGSVGWAVALTDTGGNPWGGTTVNSGSDQKSSPVWVSGSATKVWPISNNPGYAHATNRENMFPMSYFLTSPGWHNLGGRFSCIINPNNIIFLNRPGHGPALMNWFGKYSPTANNTMGVQYAAFCNLFTYDIFAMIASSGGPTPFGRIDGLTLATALGTDGGVYISGSVSNVYTMNLDVSSTSFFSPMHPNRLISGSQNVGSFDAKTLYILANQSPFFGLLGNIDFFAITQHVPAYSTSQDKYMATFEGATSYFGTTEGYVYQNSAQWLVPWDGQTVPGSGTSRKGIQFSRNG